jgi:hypothetical protein
LSVKPRLFLEQFAPNTVQLRNPAIVAPRKRDMAAEIVTLCKDIMTSFSQPESAARQWAAALDAAWVKSIDSLQTALRMDRKEKDAGREDGSQGWRAVLAAMGPAGVPAAAQPMLEAKLIELLDEHAAKAGKALAAPPADETPPVRKHVKLIDTRPLPWHPFPEAELGPIKDKSGFHIFWNEEHVNVFRFNKFGGEMDKARR